MKYCSLFILIFIVIITSMSIYAVSQNPIDNSATITGQILDSSGKPPIVSHVFLTDIGETFHNAIQILQASPDGKFELKINDLGLYNLWITAVNQDVLRIPIVISKDDKKIDLKVTLHNYSNLKFDEIKIVGSWNYLDFDFDYSKAAVMVKLPDGSYSFKTNVDTDMVFYQLLGIVEGRAANGTMADSYYYDFKGGYRSVLKVKPGPIEIIFDPSQLKTSTNQMSPGVSYDKKHQYLERIFHIDYQWQLKQSQYLKVLAESRMKKSNPSKDTIDYSDFTSVLKNILNTEKEPSVRQFAAFYYLYALGFDNKLDVATIDRVLKIIPVNSPNWGLEPNAVMILSFTIKKEQSDLLKEFYEQNPIRKVQAKALIAQALKAKTNGEQQKVHEIIDQLNLKYVDIKEIQNEIASLDPDKRIAKGKPVPDFEVKLLDTGEVVSNKSLLGKYYLIDFWASWCSGCKREFPYLNEAYRKYHDKGFQILSLSCDYNKEDIEKFRSGEWQMPWMNVFLDGGFESKLAQDFELKSLPKLILIGPDGIIVATEGDLRGAMLDKTLDEVMGNGE